jgi:hypothetical protein
MPYLLKVLIILIPIAIGIIALDYYRRKKLGLIKQYTKEEKRKTFKRLSVISIVFFIIGLLGYFKEKKDTASLIANMRFTSGYITKYSPEGPKTAGDFYFQFSVNDQIISYEQIANVWPDKGESFVGKQFPVIYDSQNPKNCSLLIFPEQFEKYNLQFPDSLKWVLQSDEQR